MAKTFADILMKSLFLTGLAILLAIGSNLIREDGIPLITDIPYEIFAPCRDSEVSAALIEEAEHSMEDGDERVLYVDARPKEIFERERVAGAINAPYSALFGALDDDIRRVAQQAKSQNAKMVVVYGTVTEPGEEAAVDLAEPLAKQLIESGLSNVKHIKGGLAELNRRGIGIVQGDGARTPSAQEDSGAE